MEAKTNGLCQCGCGGTAPLATATRRSEGIVAGQPMKFIAGHSFRVNGRRRGPLEARFWQSVEKPEGNFTDRDACWEWTGSLNTWGYGQIRDEDGKYTTAHRVSFRLHSGKPIPDGMSVLHRCDNPKCVRPDHLFLGTQADNMTDKTQKNRQAQGDAHGMSAASKAKRQAVSA